MSYVLQTTLSNPSAVSNDTFGYCASISSNNTTAVIGAPQFTNGLPGYISIYQNNLGTWSLQTTINNPTHANNDEFGYSVSINENGTLIVVGAPGYNSSQGIVYVYQYSGSAWSLLQTINDPRDTAGDQFGFSVAISSAVTPSFIVGSYGYGPNSNTGVAYLYTTSSTSPQLTISDPLGSSGDLFGYSVAISQDGTMFAIGSPGTNHTTGSVYIYQSTSSTPAVTITGTNQEDFFGWSVSLTDTRIVVGASQSIYEGGSGEGYANIYNYNTNTATLAASYSATNTDSFGTSVAISPDGDTVAIGAPQLGNPTPSGVGYVNVYHYNGTSWYKVTPTLSTGNTGDNFGNSVSLANDGVDLIIGAPFAGSNTGLTYIYESTGPCVHANTLVHTKLGVKKISDIVSGDYVLDKNNQWMQVLYNIKSATVRDFYLFPKNSFGENIPDSDFYIHGDHPVEYDGKEILPKDLMIQIPDIKLVRVENPTAVYSVCTPKRTMFQAAGKLLVCTWCPEEWEQFKANSGVFYSQQ